MATIFKLGGDECNNTAPTCNIMNLSRSYRLNEIESRVLELGLTFIPTPRQPDRKQLGRDLHVYHRRLKLLDHFNYESEHVHTPFMDPSTWVPRRVSNTIETLIAKDLEAFRAFRPRPELTYNLSAEELNAVKTLAENPALVIKPADKGSDRKSVV